MKREKEWGRGESTEVWVITFGFADLINDLSSADFNQTTLVFIIFINFHLRLHFLSHLVRMVAFISMMSQKKKTQLHCAAAGVRWRDWSPAMSEQASIYYPTAPIDIITWGPRFQTFSDKVKA